MLASVIKVNKKYYFQTLLRLLEECKYEIKKNKLEIRVNDDFDSSSSDESDSDPDSEFDSEESKMSLKNLTMNLTMILKMNLRINLLMNLRIKTVF